MGRYSGLSDEELAVKIARYETAVEEVELGGDVAVIQSDGRRMEVVRGNLTAAQGSLNEMLLERDKRANGGILPGRAVSVRIPRP